MKSSGERRYTVSVEQHNGNSVNGQLTLNVDDDWVVVAGMVQVPASLEAVIGGETQRGMKMEAGVTGVVTVVSTPRTQKITPNMRLRLGDRKLNVVSAFDMEGLEREIVIGVKELTS